MPAYHSMYPYTPTTSLQNRKSDQLQSQNRSHICWSDPRLIFKLSHCASGLIVVMCTYSSLSFAASQLSLLYALLFCSSRTRIRTRTRSIFISRERKMSEYRYIFLSIYPFAVMILFLTVCVINAIQNTSWRRQAWLRQYYASFVSKCSWV